MEQSAVPSHDASGNMRATPSGPIAHWLEHKAQQLHACWTIPGADPALANYLLNRQVKSTAFTRMANDLAMTIAAIAIMLAAGPAVSPLWGWGWVGALLVMTGAKLRISRMPGVRNDNATPRTIQVMSIKIVLTALLFLSVPIWLFLNGPADLRTLIVAVVAGLLCGGTMGWACVPAVSLSWIGCVTLLSCVALLSSGRITDWYLISALLAFSGKLVSDTMDFSKQFVARCQAEFEADRQAQMVSLLLRDFEGSSSDWFWECDAAGRVTHTSTRLSDVLGLPSAALMGRSLPVLLGTMHDHPDEVQRTAVQRLAQVLAEDRPFRDLTVPLSVAGTPSWWTLNGKPLLDGAGRCTGWRGIGVDVTAARLHEIELQRLATTDTLTGLVNRHGFNQHLHACLAEVTRAQSVTLLMVDLDGFKAVNDAHGHGTGDLLLREVGQRLQALSIPSERLARLGGDEYALIMLGELSLSRALDRAEHMLQALRQPFHIGDLRIEVRGSLGIACSPQHATNAIELQKAADMALYAAKEDGRDRVRLYDHIIGERTQSRAHLTRDLASALAADELSMDYQPVFDARTGLPVGVEALLRWVHPLRGVVAPQCFIPLAEETGLIVPIGSWALRQACVDAVTWPLPVKVAVNLSPVQLQSLGLVDEVREVLAQTGLPAHRLELELTESALAGDHPDVAATLESLRGLGTRLALDDFGTGFSSLAYLQRFHFDRLKIDRVFVTPLAHQPCDEATALVRAIVGLADALGLTCTAEGIEQASQANTLRLLGCNALQGYLLAPPMGACDLALYLQRSTSVLSLQAPQDEVAALI